MQGYASGDLDKDAFSVRYFAHERGMELMVTQSYSKNFGLYGERIGALNVVTKDAASAAKIDCTEPPSRVYFSIGSSASSSSSSSPSPAMSSSASPGSAEAIVER